MSVSGRPLISQARSVVYNVANHLKEQKALYKLKYNVVEATSLATGVSQTLVKVILKEGAKSLSTSGHVTFSTPNGKSKERKKKVQVDEFTEGKIRRKILEFYTVKRTIPTVGKINAALKKSGSLDCSREHLRKIIWHMGFRWRKCAPRRKILIEKPHIAIRRARYLRAIRKYRHEKRNIVFLDETYLSYTVGASSRSLNDIGAAKSYGKGDTLIIAHAGGINNFVKDALLIFKSKQKTGRYHIGMNASNFTKWLETQVLPNLPNNSVIVMENASYNSAQINKRPTSVTLKKDIVQWLSDNNISYDENMGKPDLLELVKKVPEEKNYVIDQVLKAHGHEVLRLPEKHVDLNPFQLVWTDVKGEVSKGSSSENFDSKEVLCEQFFAKFNAEKWKRCCDHIKKIEQEYWKADSHMEETIDSIIITPGNNSESSDNCSSDSASDFDSESD